MGNIEPAFDTISDIRCILGWCTHLVQTGISFYHPGANVGKNCSMESCVFSLQIKWNLLKRGCELKSRETARICSRRAWWVDNDIFSNDQHCSAIQPKHKFFTNWFVMSEKIILQQPTEELVSWVNIRIIKRCIALTEKWLTCCHVTVRVNRCIKYFALSIFGLR